MGNTHTKYMFEVVFNDEEKSYIKFEHECFRDPSDHAAYWSRNGVNVDKLFIPAHSIFRISWWREEQK